MNYVERNLRKGEEIITNAKISFWYLAPKILWLLLLLAAAIALTVTVFKTKPTNPEEIRKEQASQVTDADDDGFFGTGTTTFPNWEDPYQKNNPEQIARKNQESNEMNKIFKIVIWAAAGLAGGAPLILRIILILTTHLVITNKRVIGKQGVFKIQTLDIPIDKVDNVSFSASIWGNIFKFYDVTIKSVGSDGWAFHGVSNAQAFKDSANDAIEKHAEQARKDQAAQIAMAMHSGPNG